MASAKRLSLLVLLMLCFAAMMGATSMASGLTEALKSRDIAQVKKLVELLIAAHVDVNHRNIDGWSALHFAARHSRYEIVKVLLAAGADVNLARRQF
jgi:ankyrin repeat protein